MNKNKSVRNEDNSVRNDDKKKKCFLCLDVLKNSITTECRHTFCYDCLLKYCTNKPKQTDYVKCPLCCEQIVLDTPVKGTRKSKRIEAKIQGKPCTSSTKLPSCIEENKSDIFVRQTEYPNLSRKPLKTYETKKQRVIPVLETSDNDEEYASNNRSTIENKNSQIKIVQWLLDTQNEFEQLTDTQQRFGSDSGMDDEDLISISQAVAKSTPCKKAVKRNRPVKKQSRYERRCRSLDIHIKKPSKSKLKRQTIGCVSQYVESLHIEEMDNSQVNELIERTNLVRKMEEDCLDSFDNQVTTDDDTMKDILNTCIKDCAILKSMVVKHHSNLKCYPQQLVELSAYFLELHSSLSNGLTQSQNENVKVSIDIDINRSIDNEQICECKSKTFVDKDIQTEDIKVVTCDKEIQTCQIFENVGTQTDNIVILNKGVQTNQFDYKSVGSQAEPTKLVTCDKQMQTTVCEQLNCSTQTQAKQGFYITANEAFTTLSLRENYAQTDTFMCLNCNPATSQEATNEFELSESFDGIVFETQAAILANEKANKTIVNRKSQVMSEYTVTQIIDRLNQDSEPCVDVVSTNPQLNERNKIVIQKGDNSSLSGNKNAVYMKTNSGLSKDKIVIQNISSSTNRDKVVIQNNNPNISRVRNETQTKTGGKVDVLNNPTKPTTSRLLQDLDLDKVVQLNTVSVDIEENVQKMLESMKKRDVYESKASTSRESLASSNLRISMSIPSRSKRKLCFNGSENNKNFINPYDSDSDIDTPHKMRKLLRDDISIRFDTETQNESLHVVQGLGSSIEMDQLNDIVATINHQQPGTSKQSNDKQLIPEKSFNDKHTLPELVERCKKLFDDVTNKVRKQAESKGCGSISLSNLLDDDVLKDFENDYIITNEKAHPIKETPARFELSESLYNTFDTFDWSNNKENQFAKKESDVPSPKRVNILQDISLKDNEYHTDEDIFKSDSEDIIEGTPTKELKNIIIDRSQNISIKPAALNRTITPPLEFDDDLNDVTIINETQVNTSVANRRKQSESINFINSLSPIGNIQKKLNVGSQMKKKRCSSTPKDPKQLSMRRFISNMDGTPKGSEVFKIVSQPKMKVKPCIACSRLPKSEISTIHELIRLNLATYSAVFTPNVTHMIVSTTKENAVMDHTIKFVSAVASGLWVLNFKWIQDCVARQCIISEEPYEVLDESGEPGPKTARLNHKTNKILKNFRIYAAPPFTSTTQDEVEKIIIMQGATIVKRPDDLMDKVAGEICLIITETKPTEDYDIYETWLELLKVVTVDLEWLVRSIGKYKLMSLKPFAMCSDEAFCGLNYPDNLIETVPYTNSESVY